MSTQSKETIISSREARKQLQSSASLKWFHWVVILGSLLLTFFAWHYSKSEKNARIEVQFDREVERVMELVLERMGKYEDALWSGVALINTNGGETTFENWRKYAQSIDIAEKYPGVNGIGVIQSVEANEMKDYISNQQKGRPNFDVYPDHDRDVKLPIAYIIPVLGNEKAVGLDIAHEKNRYTAATKARDLAIAQISGPIKLVQDEGQTPGFLFYAPFYRDGSYESEADRKNNFLGMVYAPFVVKKLMEGTLEKSKRHVGLAIVDGSETLYDEHVATEVDFDPDPLFKRSISREMFGRVWDFEIWSSQSFRDTASDNQPLTILIGGILIDSLLVLLFLGVSRNSNRALQLADSMTNQFEANEKELLAYAHQLKQSNKDLEQFAFIASHDLQEPLRKVASFCGLLQMKHSDKLDDDGKRYVESAMDGAMRMRTLIDDLLTFSKIGSDQTQMVLIDANKVFERAISDLNTAITESNATVVKGDLPSVYARERELNQLLQNLIGNAIKYRTDTPPEISVTAESRGDDWVFSVADNGIGIAPKYQDQIFGIFKRLHHDSEYSGTGIGLAICKRVVDRLGGKIWVESEVDDGCTILFSIPKQPKKREQLALVPSKSIEQPVIKSPTQVPTKFVKADRS